MVVHQTYLLNIKYSSLLPNGSLLISCSGREEEGRYQCRATNSLDQITETVSLDVQGRQRTLDLLTRQRQITDQLVCCTNDSKTIVILYSPINLSYQIRMLAVLMEFTT